MIDVPRVHKEFAKTWMAMNWTIASFPPYDLVTVRKFDPERDVPFIIQVKTTRVVYYDDILDQGPKWALREWGMPDSMLDDIGFKSHPCYLWIGAKGYRTGCHADEGYESHLAQIVGRKTVSLWSPSALTPEIIDDGGSYLRHEPRLVPEKTFDLDPGDVIVIPKGWWHCAMALDNSISVNMLR